MFSYTFAEAPEPEVHSPIPRAAFHARGRFVGVSERSQPSPDQRGALGQAAASSFIRLTIYQNTARI